MLHITCILCQYNTRQSRGSLTREGCARKRALEKWTPRLLQLLATLFFAALGRVPYFHYENSDNFLIARTFLGLFTSFTCLTYSTTSALLAADDEPPQALMDYISHGAGRPVTAQLVAARGDLRFFAFR